jgi:dihydropteroate synthase
MPVILAGVLNVTPDSFSDGGRYASVEAAVAAGLRMVDEGAAWIDVGGESTRPGALPVAARDELARVVPVIAALAPRLGGRARISIDTYKAATAEAALAAGASLVNDVSGGRMEPELLAVAARRGAGVVLGHLRGTPATMMKDTAYGDVVAEVTAALRSCVDAARAAGCRELWCDPGIGFSKGTADNLALIAGLGRLRADLGLPIMVGVSRKQFLGELTGKPVGERSYATAGAVAACVLGGADVLRVHEVAAMGEVVRVARAVFKMIPTGMKRH